jgi:hypothetical protein
MKYIWIGVIPDIFGYGITAASLTEAGAKKTLHKAFQPHTQPRRWLSCWTPSTLRK